MIGYFRELSDRAEELARGELPQALESRSNRDVLRRSLERVVESQRNLIEQTHGLIAAAREGNLSARA